jgi:hypothetical protein
MQRQFALIYQALVSTSFVVTASFEISYQAILGQINMIGTRMGGKQENFTSEHIQTKMQELKLLNRRSCFPARNLWTLNHLHNTLDFQQ